MTENKCKTYSNDKVKASGSSNSDTNQALYSGYIGMCHNMIDVISTEYNTDSVDNLCESAADEIVKYHADKKILNSSTPEYKEKKLEYKNNCQLCSTNAWNKWLKDRPKGETKKEMRNGKEVTVVITTGKEQFINLVREDRDKAYEYIKPAIDEYKECILSKLETVFPEISSDEMDSARENGDNDDPFKKSFDDLNGLYEKLDEAEAKMRDTLNAAYDDFIVGIKPNVEIDINCDDLKFFRRLWLIIVVGAPFLFILFGSLDYFKVLVSTNEEEAKKAKKNFPKRLIAFVLLLITPFIISFILTHIGTGKSKNLSIMKCIVSGKK